jgi:hypothetical protein
MRISTRIYDDTDFNEQSRVEVQQLLELRQATTNTTYQLPSLAVRDDAKLFKLVQQVPVPINVASN